LIYVFASVAFCLSTFKDVFEITEGLGGLPEFIDFVLSHAPDEVNQEMKRISIKNNSRLLVVLCIKKVKHQVGCLTNENPQG
jgi:hypothetical protein